MTRTRSLRLLPLPVALAGGLALLLSGSSGQDSSAATAARTMTLHVEINRAPAFRQEAEPVGDSPGDVVTTDEAVYDAANRRRAGRALFVTTFGKAEAAHVSGVIRLARGTLTVSGLRLRGSGPLAVTGGTGAYAGARGTYSENHREIVQVKGSDSRSRVPVTVTLEP